jgi:hypothetical protein
MLDIFELRNRPRYYTEAYFNCLDRFPDILGQIKKYEPVPEGARWKSLEYGSSIPPDDLRCFSAGYSV